MAIGVRNYNGSEYKHDPSLVVWELHVYKGNGSNDDLE